MATIAERATNYIAKLPVAIEGAGGDAATFKAAVTLVRGFSLEPDAAFSLLSAWNATHCQPPWDESRLRHKLTMATKSTLPEGYLLNGGGEVTGLRGRSPLTFAPPVKTPPAQPKWPARNNARIASTFSEKAGEADLSDRSPVRIEPGALAQDELLRALFGPANPLVCLGSSQQNCFTLPLEEIVKADLTQLQFVVPSPMTARKGVTTEGKESPRAKSIVGPRRFIVCDFDFRPKAVEADAELCRLAEQHGHAGTRDVCASIIHHLAAYAPLSLVVWSGGKSLHGWFTAAGATEETVRRFFSYAVLMGADPATWTGNQLVRLPLGTREDNGAVQTVIYFNPHLLPAS